MTIQQLRNITGYFLQLEERAKADCYPYMAMFARRQGVRYMTKLKERKAANG